MKKLLLIGFLGLGLSACQTASPTIVDQSRTLIIEPPKALLNCPEFRNYPAPSTMTNRQLAGVITGLVQVNRTCAINMKGIEKFIAEAKEINR